MHTLLGNFVGSSPAPIGPFTEPPGCQGAKHLPHPLLPEGLGADAGGVPALAHSATWLQNREAPHSVGRPLQERAGPSPLLQMATDKALRLGTAAKSAHTQRGHIHLAPGTTGRMRARTYPEPTVTSCHYDITRLPHLSPEDPRSPSRVGGGTQTSYRGLGRLVLL